MKNRINAGGIIFAALAGFLLAVGIIQGAAMEGARILSACEDRATLATLATRAGVEVPPDLIRAR